MATYKKYKDLSDEPERREAAKQEAANLVTQQMANPSASTAGTCIQIMSAQHKQHIIKNHDITVVDVSAEWCQPCQIVGPLFVELAKSYALPGYCAFAHEDVDSGFSPEVTGVPAFHFYKKGEKVSTIMGANIDNVKNRLMELLAQK
jgi:thioredoxin 1